MVVTNNSGVVCVDLGCVDGAAVLVEDPLLTLGVGRLVCLDVVEESFAVDTESVEGHLVEASSCCRVVRVKFTDGVEGSFLPEAWEVKDTERSGDTGGDGRNDLAHFFVL